MPAQITKGKLSLSFLLLLTSRLQARPCNLQLGHTMLFNLYHKLILFSSQKITLFDTVKGYDEWVKKGVCKTYPIIIFNPTDIGSLMKRLVVHTGLSERG